MTRLDSWLPDPLVRSTHAIVVAAPIAVAYQALLDVDFSRHPLVALLLGVRLIPAVLFAPRETWRKLRDPRLRSNGRLRSLAGSDFALLEEEPPHELVIGITGRFWRPSGGLVASSPETFREPVPPGLARAAWNFHLEAIDDGHTRLGTETRVRCGDEATSRRFRLYWRLIAPGSGAIRWAILRHVRRAAERAAQS